MGSLVQASAVGLTFAGVLALARWLWTPDKKKADLEAAYARGPDDFIEVKGVRLHVRDSGPRGAPTVILLHGFGSSLHTWEGWALRLSRDFRVVRYDLPGAALTGPDPTETYADARGLEILGALMDRLGVARASVVGNSLGGRLAWKLAALHPERVHKLVLISPDGFESPGFAYGKAPRIPAVLRLMRYVLPKAVLRLNLKPAYGTPAKLKDDVVTRYHDLMLAPGVRAGLLVRMAQTILVDPVPLLARIEAPTLLLWGVEDRMIPFTNAADYARALANATVAPLPGLGHVPHEEEPERSLEPVLAFLKA